MRLLRSGGWRLAALVGVAVGLGVGGIAYAAIPDGSGVIHGCYAKRDGVLRVIDTATGGACSAAKETALDWSQTGPQGLPGNTGATGPPGPAGPQGPGRQEITVDATGAPVSLTTLATLNDKLSVTMACGNGGGIIFVRPLEPYFFVQGFGTVWQDTLASPLGDFWLAVGDQFEVRFSLNGGAVLQIQARPATSLANDVGSGVGTFARIDLAVRPCHAAGTITLFE